MSSRPRVHQRFLRPAVRRAAAWAVLIAVAACSLTTEAVPTTDVASVSVNPPTMTLSVGSQFPLQALVDDALGKPVAGTSVFWSVQNPTIATVSSTGVVTGMAVGSTEVSASANGRSGIATITVQKAPVASVVVTPPHVDAAPGVHTPLTATAYDAAQNPLTDRVITWSTSNASVATVDANGVMLTVGPGNATITATSEGKSGTATVTVSQAAVATVTVKPSPLSMSVGQTTQLTDTLRDAQGNVLNGRVVTWSTSNPNIATVSSQGTVTAVAQGTATITATSEGAVGTAALSVSNVAVGSVTVQPQSPSIQQGFNVQLSATVRDVNGVIVTDRVITWSSGNAAVATVSSTGVVTGTGAGSATITATSEGKSGSSTVTVSLVPVGSVSVTPASVTIRITGTTTLAAIVKDVNGLVVTNRGVTWSSSTPGVATVSAAGEVTGVALGTTTITATSETKSGTASVTVTNIPVGSITLAPLTKALLVTQTVTLTPTVKDSTGAVVTDRPLTWGSNATGVATVSSTGVVTAVAPGTATISASAEGKSGSSTIAVSPVPVGIVVVTPPTDSLAVNGAIQLTATTEDSVGGVLTGRVVTWGSSNPAAATVSATGLVTATANAGSTTITATSEGKSGTSAITVYVPVATVSVAPPTATIFLAQTQAFTATTKDAGGNVLTGRKITWSSTNPAAATVNSATGLATAVGPGTTTITATSEGKSGTASLTVLVPVANVLVAPSSDSLVVNGTIQLTATPVDSVGGALTGRTVTWGSSNPAAATVSATGLVTAGANAGTTTITATSEGKSGTSAITVYVPVATVTVTPSPVNLFVTQTQQFTVTTKDAGGNVLTGRKVTWGSSSPLVASVSTTGLATALLVGTTTITATSEGKSGTATLNVALVPVASVHVTPTSDSLAVSSTIQLTAATLDSIGGTLTGRVITWGSDNTSVATVSATGLVTASATATGLAHITATSEGKSGTSAITVYVPVASVTVAPGSAAILPTQTQTFTATTKDAGGNVLTGRLVTWGSSVPGVATVNSSGVATAVGQGTTTITASSEGKSGTASLTVLVPVANVLVSPTTDSLVVNGSVQLTATPVDAGNNPLTGRTVTWGSSNPAAATVSATGLVTATGNPGTTTITATSEGKSGSSVITVYVPVASVTVAPPTSSVTVGNTTTLTAATLDASSNPLTGRLITWNSLNPTVATVSATGVVTLVSRGTATITATSEGKVGSATVTGTAASVTVAPALDTTFTNGTVTLTATALDAHGVAIPGVAATAFTWSSDGPGFATVSTSGVVTGKAIGSANISAQIDGKSGSSSVTVLAPPVASVTISPHGATIFTGGSVPLTAVVKDVNGTDVTAGHPPVWSSTAPTVASVTQAGVVSAIGPGTTQIIATTDGKSDTVTVTVLATVASITITPAADVAIGATVTLTANFFDASSNPISGRTVTWSITPNDGSLATLTTTGGTTAQLKGVAAGSVTITATLVLLGETPPPLAGTLSVNIVP